MFGQAWMFSGMPTGWEARAREDTLCYALAAEDVVPLLSGPAGLRFVARVAADAAEAQASADTSGDGEIDLRNSRRAPWPRAAAAL